MLFPLIERLYLFQLKIGLDPDGLPTTQDGLVIISGSDFQAGLTSLGERSDQGDGFLGTFQFTVSNIPIERKEVVAQFLVNRFILQLPPDSIDTTQGQGYAARTRIFIEFDTSKPVTSDFNDNGVVDFIDFIQLASVFGTIQGKDEKYDSRLDLVLDGSIDFQDFLLFASHFGKTPVPIR